MAIEGLRKHSTTLFDGVLSGQQSQWSGLLPQHTNLTNHQLVMTASETVDVDTGRYAVYVIPDTEDVAHAVNTGLVLDLSERDSAIVNFTGVIRGLVLQATDIILQPSVKISAVLSSYSRYKRSGVQDNIQERLDYVSTELKEMTTGAQSYSAPAANHSNLVYHQLHLMADEAIDDVYNLRIVPESETPLETTVSLDKTVDFGSTNSVLVYFGGIITGVHLERVSGSSSNTSVRAVLSSSVERHDEIIYEYIGESPDLGDHVNDFDNPHQVTYDQLGGDKPIVGFPIVRDVLPGGADWIIPLNHQLIVWETYQIHGKLTVASGGELIVLHDRPEARAEEPDFTYNLSGELTQIDYGTGEQKLFAYSSGQLSQVDIKRDGTTLRKSFFYTGGGELDYVTEEWI